MRHTLKEWILVTRPWSFPASVTPVIVSLSFAFYQSKNNIAIDINWLNAALAFLGALIFHAAGNLISDYYDFINKVDRKESYGSNRMVIDGIFEAKTVLKYGLALLILGSAIGFYLYFRSGIYLLLIGLVGVLGTLFYYKGKYNALGDFVIFIVFGLMVGVGAYYAITSTIGCEIWLVSVPLGLLITAILHANNSRDIMHDKAIGIKTPAIIFGIRGSKIEYALLLIFSYIVVIVLIFLKILPYANFSVLLTLPLAIKHIVQMNKLAENSHEVIFGLDAKTAQLVLLFAVVWSISNFIF